ncbi:hypothetical protein [Desulfovibrio sp. JC022]|uniref:hypothetical protein n=1 Tax=Desulfovibrio sp. JC022 TaxID=2593642 RepID=UPI0013D3EF6F|nr:hypothetical protein [Desulfovibrio sp. JC022]NDV22602.1 hypothetical protein [Desulfovibrio sp. JC022]
MCRSLFITVIYFLYFALASVTSATATDLPRLLVVGDDSSHESLSCETQPFKAVINTISNSLLNEGFDVKDEAAFSTGSATRKKIRRDDAELIREAKKLGIDIAIIFSIFPNINNDTHSTRITPRVEGRIVSVYDGSRLGNFNIKSQISKPISNKYGSQEALTDTAHILGKEVGEVLTGRIIQYVDAEGGRLQEWVIVFDGFNRYDVMDMEDMFRTFSGYDAHRVKPNSGSRSGHDEFFYKSNADSAKLKRDFTRMLGKLNIKGTISVSGLKISIAKNRGLKSKMMQKNSW